MNVKESMDSQRPGPVVPPNMPQLPSWNDDARRGRRTAIYGVLTGMAIVLAALIGLQAAGVFQIRAAERPGGALQARAETSVPGFLQARGEKAPPALGVPTDTTAMPQAIRDWLEHLRRIEERKNALHRKQASEAEAYASNLGLTGGLSVADVDRLSSPDGTSVDLDMFSKMDEFFAGMAEPWRGLKADFVAYPPPDGDCRKIADAYEQGLMEVPGQIEDLRNLISGFKGDGEPTVTDQGKATSDARRIGSEHPRVLDDAFSATDGLVQKICDKYNTRKWFRIERGNIGGGAFGVGKGLGL